MKRDDNIGPEILIDSPEGHLMSERIHDVELVALPSLVASRDQIIEQLRQTLPVGAPVSQVVELANYRRAQGDNRDQKTA